MSALHLQRIKLEQFRRFYKPFEISDLAPGLTVIHGPQEAGKSTIATAIRAAFLERCGSNVHVDYQPHGDSGASPTVELDFQFQGVPHSLKKTFVKRTRCDLSMGTTHLNSTDAEDRLADLFGFGFAAKGKNRAENLGIPGLLWVEQGHHQVADSITHGATHIRGSLQSELAELTSSTGDALIERVQKERGELLTDSGALRKNGPLHQADQREAELRESVAELEARVHEYRSDVDRYAELLPELEAIRAQKPWEEMRHKRDQAKNVLAQANLLQERYDQASKDAERARRNLEATREQLTEATRKRNDLAQKQSELESESQRLLELEKRAAEAKRKLETAVRERNAAAELRDRARAASTRSALEGKLQASREAVEKVEHVLARAEEIAREAGELRSRASGLSIDPEAVERIGQIEADIRVLQATLESAATRLTFALEDGSTIQAGDEVLNGNGDRLLTSETWLEIPTVGRIGITPGGSADLGLHQAELHELTLERERLLGSMGVANHSEAVARLAESREVARALQQQQALLSEVAPSGLDAMRDQLQAARTHAQELEEQLRLLPPLPEDALSEEEAQDAAERAATNHTAAAVQANQAESEASHARASLESRQAELQQLQSMLESPEFLAKVEALNAAVDEGAAEVQQHDEKLHELVAQVQALDLEFLEMEVDRFANAEEQARDRFARLTQEKDRIESRLQTGDAIGVEEQLAHATGELEAVSRRRGELQRRADALTHLLHRLQAHRAELTRKLTEPLAKAIQPYLDILMPGTGARMEIDESLVPRQLVRESGPAAGAVRFEELSHGTQEQLSVVVRLAYAALLAEQGHPAMVMLDDQLVHSDNDRFEQMKKVILKAARRHQVLVFTCHPDRWLDAGAPLVDIRAA